MPKATSIQSKLHVPSSAVESFIQGHYNLTKSNSAFSHVPTPSFKNQVKHYLAARATQQLATQGHGKNIGQLERISMKEIFSNPLLANMKRQVEIDSTLMKASFYVPKGALSNSTNKMVPVLVRRNNPSRSDEELSTGAEGSFENSETKSKSPKSRAITRPTTQVLQLKKNLNSGQYGSSALLDKSTQEMLRTEDFNSVVSQLIDF